MNSPALTDVVYGVLGTTPLSTSEVIEAVAATYRVVGNPHDLRGVLIEHPFRLTCRCGHEHDCTHLVPITSTLVRPVLDKLTRRKLVTKISRGTSKSCLWVRVATAVPDTLDDIVWEPDTHRP